MTFKRYLYILIFSTITYLSIGQTNNNEAIRRYPITRDTLNAYPDSLMIEGKLVDYTLGLTCGVFCGCGTLKVILTKQNYYYAYDYIYVGVPCFSFVPNELMAKTKWILYKLPFNDNSCFWTEAPT